MSDEFDHIDRVRRKVESDEREFARMRTMLNISFVFILLFAVIAVIAEVTVIYHFAAKWW